jgi:hypothetical protein
MAKEEIEIQIDASGKVIATVIGAKGPKCMDLADLVVQLVGKELSRAKTSEFYEIEGHACEEIHLQQRRK